MIFLRASLPALLPQNGESMDWNGILGIVIALVIITLVIWGAQPLMDFLEHFFERGQTQDDLEQVDQTL
jgi:hypothetical protein